MADETAEQRTTNENAIKPAPVAPPKPAGPTDTERIAALEKRIDSLEARLKKKIAYL
jgi:hypothetical protein